MIQDRTEQQSRPQVPAEVRRERLLDAALMVMKRDGVAAATTRAICTEARMPHGAFHYCFRSKGELLTALLMRGIHVDLAKAWPAVSPALNAADNICTLLRAYWAQVEEDPDGQLVLFDLGSSAMHDLELQYLPRLEYESSLEQAIEHLGRLEREAGFHFSIEHRVIGELLLASLNGLTWSWLTHRDDEVARAAVDQLAVVLASLVSPEHSEFATG